jgi:aminoglycoside phosphotransferase (APT) family kinase protein
VNDPGAAQKDAGATGPVTADPTAPVAAEALRTWLAEVCDGEVTAWRRLVSGNSRTSYAADVQAGDERLEVIVRHDEGGGPVAGTELSLEREVTVYRALAGSGLPVPRLRGASSSLRAMAVTRMAGSDAEPERALPDLLVRLAELHRLAIDELELPGFARTAEGDLELWSDIAHQKLAQPDEVIEFALDLLRELFPGEPERLVLTHGDVGEGNFLAQGDRVSALLDWEFAHLGDPHDDLAWITVRALMFGHRIDGFDALVRESYAPAAGVSLSSGRMRYWQAVVILRNLICCESVAAGPERSRDRFLHLSLLPGLRHRLVHLLADLYGVSLSPADPLPAAFQPPGQRLLDEVVAGLGELLDEIPEAEPRQRAKRMRRLLGSFAETWSVAAEVAQVNAADRAASGPDRASRLQYLGRALDRELALTPRLSPIARCPLAGLEDPT